MKVIIHQSICGEVNKAWGLIKTTLLEDVNIAKSIAFRTDLQDQTSGINWNPAIRGFSEGDYFLIMKTFEDTTPDVRRGRKFSHVLMIPKKEIIRIDNIEPIISLLPQEINKNILLEPISMEISLSNMTSIPDVVKGKFNKLINGYINLKNHNNTLIWVGQDDFSVAVVELWKRLTVSERQSFQFGIAFNNDHKGSNHINLIAVPESVQSKFVRSDFFIIGKNDNHEPTELIEQLLIGDPSVQQRISNFEKTIESNSLSREDIALIAKVIDTFEQVDSINDIKKLNTLSHIIAKYAPSDKQGTDFKQRLLNKILQLAESANFSDLNILRHFKTESFKYSKKTLSTALIGWMKKRIFSIENKSVDYTSFFEQVEKSNLNWWDKVMTQELESYLGTLQASKIATLYAWLMESPTILSIIKSFIDKSKNAESYFIEKLPKKISEELNEELQEFSISNNWLRLYAHLLDRQFELDNALTELFKIDQDENYFEAIEVIITGKDDNSIVDYAIGTGESRMIKIAGKICYNESKHLKKMDVLNANWQLIWVEAIENGDQVEAGLKEPEKEIHKLFDYLIDGNVVSERLIDKISLSEFGNLLTYPKRANLWEKLPVSIKDNFLVKTSATLLEQLSKNSTIEIPNDTVLSDYISRKGIADFLYFNRNNIKSVIPIFEKFPQLSDYNLRDYLNNFSGQISVIDATQLGKLIARKRFSSSAYAINAKASKHNNWKYTLAECHHLLDFITKGLLLLAGTLSSVDITEDQWWQSAEELIVELYPNGTSLTTIWKKAGGKESELLAKGTSSEIWSDVFYKLRKGHFKEITMNDLLKEVKKQYGNNQKFKIIYNLRKSFIKT
ncbi:MAG TPA: effector-associated domain EAD1-containing protein [Aequorivita sp.]|nr:effector-associated domain EAD1-containing protein [Aequorivita sp.]